MITNWNITTTKPFNSPHSYCNILTSPPTTLLVQSIWDPWDSHGALITPGTCAPWSLCTNTSAWNTSPTVTWLFPSPSNVCLKVPFSISPDPDHYIKNCNLSQYALSSIFFSFHSTYLLRTLNNLLIFHVYLPSSAPSLE